MKSKHCREPVPALSVEKLISEADNVFGLSSVGGGGPAVFCRVAKQLLSLCHQPNAREKESLNDRDNINR